jgi:hypothetical protein
LSSSLLLGPLLFSRRKWLVKLAINQEVAQDPAWTPCYPVGPALDSRGVFLVDKDTAATNERIALAIMGASRDVVEMTDEASFKEN